MTDDTPTLEMTVKEVKELDTDTRGRVHLGPEYADQTVKVAIVE